MSNKENQILNFILENQAVSSKEIHEGIPTEFGYATIKRTLADLKKKQFITTKGQGKGTTYSISPAYEVLKPIDLEEYFLKEIDDRKIKESFNLNLMPDVLSTIELFSSSEIEKLKNLQNLYTQKVKELTETEYNKELERLAIDLSWKSSQIEGNTYSLLETERLLKEKETAAGKTKDDATMLLNHKEAIDFIVADPAYLNPLSLARIEDIHSILMKELGIERNIRLRRVGISGTNYTPLDNEFQIREALQDMCYLINKKQSIFEKAFLALILISYIQGFNDGNKRTARILSNAILILNKHCPISFRTIDSITYKKAMLVFYEQNNVAPLKNIFIGQFEFAVKTYF